MYSYNVVFDSKSGYDNIDYTQIYNKKNNMQDYEIIKDANDAEIFIWLNIFISKNISIKRNRCFLICCLNIFYVLL